MIEDKVIDKKTANNPEDKTIVEAETQSFLKKYQRLIIICCVLATLCLPLSPILYRLVATGLEVAPPYIKYKKDPENRHKIVAAVYSAMDNWPAQAQELLVPMFDRMDSGQAFDPEVISPLFKSTYGFEIDTKEILRKWQLEDEADSLSTREDAYYVQKAEVIKKEIQALKELQDQSISFEDRLSLLPPITQLEGTFPHINNYKSETYFEELTFVKAHQEWFPRITLDQLRFVYSKVTGLLFDPSNPQPVNGLVRFEEFTNTNELPDKIFEFYWPLFQKVIPDSFELFIIIDTDFHHLGITDRIEVLHTLFPDISQLDPALIWLLSESKNILAKSLVDGLQKPDLFVAAYDISPEKIQQAITALKNFSASAITFEEQKQEARSVLLAVNSFLSSDKTIDLMNAPEISFQFADTKNREATPVPEGTTEAEKIVNDYYESFTDRPADISNELTIAEISLEISQEEAADLFVAIMSLTRGDSFYVTESNVHTDRTWSIEKAVSFYQDIFKNFPEISHKVLVEASQYIIWKQVENGNDNSAQNARTAELLITIHKDTLKLLVGFENQFVSQYFIRDLFEPFLNQEVMLHPVEMANSIPGLTKIGTESANGVFGEVDISTIKLSSEIFRRNTPLNNDEVALVIPWSYFLNPDSTSGDGGLINPALQLSAEGKIVPISSAENEGDLNILENRRNIMFAITKDGRILQQPWGDFGSNTTEIYENLKQVGVKLAFGPNYLFRANSLVPVENMYRLGDLITSFLVIYENEQGDQKLGFMVVKPAEYNLGTQDILEIAQKQAPAGFTKIDILWGDPGHQVYFRGGNKRQRDDEGAYKTNQIVIGLAERETHRMIFSPKVH